MLCYAEFVLLWSVLVNLEDKPVWPEKPVFSLFIEDLVGKVKFEESPNLLD